jgi:hypothetical protein
MAPHWFELVAWAALAVGFASALVIGADIALLGNRQHTGIMNLVFPLTALYMGPVAIWAYVTRGRRMSHKQMHPREAVMTNDLEPRDSSWHSPTAIAAPACPRRHLSRVDRLGERLDDPVDCGATDPPIDSSSHWS